MFLSVQRRVSGAVGEHGGSLSAESPPPTVAVEDLEREHDHVADRVAGRADVDEVDLGQLDEAARGQAGDARGVAILGPAGRVSC